MTPRQLAFIDAYLVHPNATEAAIKAGYSARTAKQVGHKVLNLPAVAEIIAKRREKLSAKSGLTAELLDRKLAALLDFDPRAVLNDDGSLKKPSQWDDATAAAVAGLEVDEIGVEGVVIGHTKKLKLADRIRPIELGYKRLGLLKDSAAFQVGALTIVIQD